MNDFKPHILLIESGLAAGKCIEVMHHLLAQSLQHDLIIHRIDLDDVHVSNQITTNGLDFLLERTKEELQLKVSKIEYFEPKSLVELIEPLPLNYINGKRLPPLKRKKY